MVDYPDIINYSREELLEEFCKLFDRYQDLRESNESDTQKIHELKRSLDTAIAAQSYLSQELEQYTNADSNPDDNEFNRTQTELMELKKKYGKLELSFKALQQDYNTLIEENSAVCQNLEEALKRKENIPVVVENKISEEDLLRIQHLEDENMDLLQKMQDFEEGAVRYTLTIAEYEKNMEILRDQITCLEENLQSKRIDLEEKLQILESTQEQLAEANAKIAMLSTAPENNDRKGNSLFAEVDDQRQAMKQLLTAQKKRYDQMKKIYNESEHEIRRLKRENISMHTELEACSSIFCNADKIYQEKLNARVHHLLNLNEELERKLSWTQDRLKELASGKEALWLNSMLSFCKNETDDLKLQLHRVRIQKASLEEQLRNAQQDMARWRFESLKSRCILIDREHLLVENKISFKPVQAIEYHICEKDQNEARPRIISNRRSSTFDNIVARRSMTPIKEVKSKTDNISQLSTKTKTILTETQNESSETTDVAEKVETEKENSNLVLQELSENAEAIIVIEDNSTTPKKTANNEHNIITEENSITLDKTNNLSCSINNNLSVSSDIEDKENCNSSVVSSLPDGFAKLKVNPPSPMRPSQRFTKKTPPARSILTKQRQSITTEPVKNVKFSSKADTVHTLSTDTPSTSKAITGNKDPKSNLNKKTNSKTVVKQARTKSNIVVRHVVVSSKHD